MKAVTARKRATVVRDERELAAEAVRVARNEKAAKVIVASLREKIATAVGNGRFFADVQIRYADDPQWPGWKPHNTIEADIAQRVARILEADGYHVNIHLHAGQDENGQYLRIDVRWDDDE